MSETKNDMNLIIRVQATPNPNAWKFVMNKPVLNEGKMTYSSIEEAKPSLLASALFQIEGVRQVEGEVRQPTGAGVALAAAGFG